MAKTQRSDGTSDFLMGFLDSTSRFLLWTGILATAVSVGYLVYTYIVFRGGGGSPAQAMANIDLFMKVMLAGLIGLGVATTYIFWGEEVLAPIQLMGAAVLFFAPKLLPLAAGESTTEVGNRILSTLALGGGVFGIIGILSLAVDVTGRIRIRSKEGARAEQLKYGKGVKEEKDIQNVFMGKCWQLPFCRKFVRDRCPIYHARRTCWKEQVGCMCEESVIRNAMEGKVIPKDVVAATKYIPYNTKLTPAMKVERCKQCVIYNEHQKHKYKLAMPLIFIVCGMLWYFGRPPLLAYITQTIQKVNKSMGTLAMASNEAQENAESIGLTVFRELLLVCLVLVIAAYLMKIVEFLFFRVKV